MKIITILAFIFLLSVSACAENQAPDFTVYSTSMPFYNTRMLLEFEMDDVSKTPVCRSIDTTFPLSQADAISAALKWASEDFDKGKKWRVDQVSLHFVSVGIDDPRCLYVVQLMPLNEMQSLPIGVFTNGKIQSPVPEKGE